MKTRKVGLLFELAEVSVTQEVTLKGPQVEVNEDKKNLDSVALCFGFTLTMK